jgi:transcriptional regulator with XRE-family HTH domain
VGDIVAKVEEWLEKDKLILLEGWARDGLTEEQIAKNMGIGRTTLYEWKKKEPNIANTLKKGKEVIDFEVENALLKKALGYTVTLNKQKVTKDGDVVDIQEDVHIAPDTTAQIFWLKNRKPDKWRDKVQNDDDEKDIKNAKEIIFKIKEIANNERND